MERNSKQSHRNQEQDKNTHFLYTYLYSTWSLSSSSKTTEGDQGIQTESKEVNVSLCVDDALLYINDP